MTIHMRRDLKPEEVNSRVTHTICGQRFMKGDGRITTDVTKINCRNCAKKLEKTPGFSEGQQERVMREITHLIREQNLSLEQVTEAYNRAVTEEVMSE